MKQLERVTTCRASGLRTSDRPEITAIEDPSVRKLHTEQLPR